jgi:hypothetical protein
MRRCSWQSRTASLMKGLDMHYKTKKWMLAAVMFASLYLLMH